MCKFFKKRSTDMRRITKIMNSLNAYKVWNPAGYDIRTGV